MKKEGDFVKIQFLNHTPVTLFELCGPNFPDTMLVPLSKRISSSGHTRVPHYRVRPTPEKSHLYSDGPFLFNIVIYLYLFK